MENELVIASILYHPTRAELAALSALADWGGRLVLMNNGADEGLSAFPPGTEILGDGTNIGVSRGLNAILRHAFETGREGCVLFLDQDSLMDVATLRSNWPRISALLEGDDTVLNLRESDASTPQVQRRRLLINSGTLFTRAAWDRIGGMDERYFVDGVDYDYSLRLHCAGFAMYTFGVNGLFDHTTHQAGRPLRILGKTIWIRNYGSRYREIYGSLVRLLFQSLARLELGYAIMFTKALAITLAGQFLGLVFGSDNSERS